MERPILVCASAAVTLVACNAILGINPAVVRAGDASTSDASASDAIGDGEQTCSPQACAPKACCGKTVACIDLGPDKDNCGACGHSCLGGDCVNGSCQPFTLASGPFPTGLATDGIAIYFTEDALPDPSLGIKRCTIEGCNKSPTPLAWNRQWAFSIAVDSTYVYWTEYANVLRCSKTSCVNAPYHLFQGVAEVDWPAGIAIDNTDVYWTDGVKGTLRKCSKMGCNNTPFTIAASLARPTGLAVDGTSVYWANTDAGTVVKCPTTGCSGSPTVLASNQNAPYGIALDQANVYFTNWNAGVAKCAIGGCNDKPTVLVTLGSGQGVRAIAVDATDVYFVTYDGGTLLKCAIAGCNDSPTLVATPLAPRDVVVDAVSIYWNDDFQVKRLAK